jgi:hypothetical protein
MSAELALLCPVLAASAPTVVAQIGGGEERMDEDRWDDASEWDDLPEWSEQHDGGAQGAAGPLDDVPTPGERLLYTLGQLYLLWHRGELDVAPREFDIEDLARIIGVGRDIEFVSDGPVGRSYHMPGEVLLVDEGQRFPWRLLSLDGWAWAMDGLRER